MLSIWKIFYKSFIWQASIIKCFPQVLTAETLWVCIVCRASVSLEPSKRICMNKAGKVPVHLVIKLSRLQMIFKIGDLINFCNIHMKASVRESSFNEVTRYWIFVRFYLPIDVSPCFCACVCRCYCCCCWCCFKGFLFTYLRKGLYYAKMRESNID